MNKLKVLVLAVRPWSFVVSIVAVLIPALGLKYLGYDLNPLMVIWAVFGIVLFHAAGNTMSDYFDFVRGIDADDTYGQIVLKDKLMKPKQMLWLGITLTLLACINGILIWWATDWNVRLLVLGGMAALLTLTYSLFKFMALGDIVIFFNFGIFPAVGTCIVAMGYATWDVFWFVPLFVPITNAVLHANNTRDVLTDRRAGIITMPMIIGKKASQWLYYIEVWTPFLWTILLVCIGKLPWPALFALASVRMIWFNCKTMAAFSTDDHAIDHLDERTAQLQWIHSSALLIGLLFYNFIMRV